MIAMTAPLQAILAADAAVKALVAARIWPDVLPQKPTSTGTSWVPAIVITHVGPMAIDQASDGPTGSEVHHIQLDAYAETRTAADAVMVAVAKALSPRGVRAGTPRVAHGVEIQGAFEMPGGGAPTHEDDTKLYRRSRDFEVHAAEAA